MNIVAHILSIHVGKFFKPFTLAAVLCFSTTAHALYPSGPIKLIVPFPAGGPTDIISRLIASKLSFELAQPVYVENKAGAHGAIGLQSSLMQPSDGQTIAMVSIGTHGINPVLYSKLAYDANKDFIPISLLVTVPIVVVARVDAPFNDLGELIRYAKQHPGKLSFASAGSGGSSHLVPEMFKQLAGIDIVHVPYKGIAPAMTDLLSGQVNLMFDSLITSTQQVASGKLKIIATTSAKRLVAYPQVPTVAESGFEGFEAQSWYGIVVKSGTAPQVVNVLTGAFQKIMRDPEVIEKLTKINTNAIGSTSQEFAHFMKQEQAKWDRVITQGHIQAE